MKSRFLLTKQDGTIVIEELCELDPGVYSSLCEKTLDADELAVAVQEGLAAVVELFRDINMFPPHSYALQIAENIIFLFHNDNESEKELNFADIDYLAKGEKPIYIAADTDPETSEIEAIDEMLGDDDVDDEVILGDEFTALDDPESGSLKVADDDLGDMDLDV